MPPGVQGPGPAKLALDVPTAAITIAANPRVFAIVIGFSCRWIETNESLPIPFQPFQ
jgi:hypothetical protein